MAFTNFTKLVKDIALMNTLVLAITKSLNQFSSFVAMMTRCVKSCFSFNFLLLVEGD